MCFTLSPLPRSYTEFQYTAMAIFLATIQGIQKWSTCTLLVKARKILRKKTISFFTEDFNS